MEPDIDSFAELKITKNRGRSDTKSLLPNTFDPDDGKDPEVPMPEAAAKLYTKERLQKSLIYAEKFLKLRNISPRSELFMDFYKNSIKAALTAETPTEREERAIDVLIEEKLIQLARFLKPYKTAKQAELEDHLLELREMQYLARYGDYLKILPTKVRHYASINKIQDWELTSARLQWTDVADAIIAEEERRKEADRLGSKMKDEGLPTTTTIKITCRDLGLSPDTVIWSIKAYARRNRELHRSIDNMKEEGKFSELANTLYADKNDLDSVFSCKSATDTEHLKEIIQDEIDLYFDTNDFPDNPDVWSPSKVLSQVFRDAQAKAQKPTKDEVRKANKEADKERSQAKAARQKEASLESATSGKNKRVASSEEPWGSERVQQGRKRREETEVELLARQTKLQGQLATIMAELARRGETFFPPDEEGGDELEGRD